MTRTYRNDYHRIASRLSPRAALLLRLVDQRTTRVGDGTLTRYYVPQAADEFIRLGRSDNPHTTERISGSGDASAFKGLANAGLIARPRGTTIAAAYCYEITEAGRIVVEELYTDTDVA